MKAKYAIAMLAILGTFICTNAQHQVNIPLEENNFKPGAQVYVFGNDVKLRSAPDTESEVLDLLKIGEWVQIIEKTAFSWPYKGFDSHFYKVKYDDVTGYILGGLLSLERKTLNGQNYFFAYSKEGGRIFLNIRYVQNGTYLEKKVRLAHAAISIKTLDDQGVPGLDGMLFIDYQAEACGVEGGGIYLFAHNNGQLTKVASLSQVSDAGVFYRAEKFIFPSDVDGLPDKILFKKEQGEVYDETTNWTKTSVEIRELSWVNGALVPEYKQQAPN